MGAVTTWQVYMLCGDLCRYYAPLACDSWPTAQFDGAKKPTETAETLASASKVFRLSPEDYVIWCGVGDRDQTMMQMGKSTSGSSQSGGTSISELMRT